MGSCVRRNDGIGYGIRSPVTDTDSNFKQLTIIPSLRGALATTQSSLSYCGEMDCFVACAPRNDVEVHVRDLAARMRPSRAKQSAPKFRGRRECRALDAPAASHAK